MITFSSKITQTIEKSILCFDDKMRLWEQIKELFQRNQSEIILIYEGEQYCGYIEKENIYDIVIPEFYLGYEPFECEASDKLIEEIIEYKNKTKRLKKQIKIPLKHRKQKGLRDFIEESDDALKLSEYLGVYEKYNNAPFLLESFPDKNIVSFGELNELTYWCFKILRKRNQRYIIKGKYWNYINVCGESVNGIKQSEILECNYTLVADFIESQVKKEITKKINDMKQKGINAYKIIIPTYEELNVHGELEKIIRNEGFCSASQFIDENVLNRKKWLDIFMKTEFCETEKELLSDFRPEQYGEEEITIYLVGPCIVSGVMSTEKSSLAYMLYQKVKNMSYNVKKIVAAKHDITLIHRIESLDIKNNDFIFFITDSCMYQKEADDIDMLDDYNNRPIDQYWFLDEPIHSLRHGNEMIVEKLYSFIKRNSEQNKVENQYIQIGRPHLNGGQKEELQKYISSIRFKKDDSAVGCIVMNANPFTQGHLYLVEWAAKEVDKLLVFVVEEDLSEFAFLDRLQMVREGTKYIKNICVIPSGRFILSNQTFGSYFEKDKKQNQKVNAALDIKFFGAYIVPAFGISKRFVGEEPKDTVTRQYNEEMRRELPKYGVEVIEIPRKEVHGNVISATTVRKLYERKEWKDLSYILPDTTMNYLISNNIVLRNKESMRIRMDIPNSMINGLKSLISRYERIIFYAVGRDCKGLYMLVDAEEKEKVIFVDKKAKKREFSFEGKRVYNPGVLLKELRTFPILITSTQFGKQIYVEFKEQGINSSRLIQNLYSFYDVSV